MEKTTQADERLIFLIDKAVSIAGSQAKLARMLDMPGQHITNWLSGQRTCTPEDRARLAGMCGLDANQELIRSIIEKHEGTKKGDDLRHFLGKSLLAIGAAVASSGASAAAIFSTTQGLPALDALLMLLSTMYIMSNYKTIHHGSVVWHAVLALLSVLGLLQLVALVLGEWARRPQMTQA